MPARGQETDSRPPKRRLKDERGVALLEFALVLPLLMLLLLGMVDFGKAFTIWIDETHLANSAARYAAVNSAPTAGCDGCLESDIENQADTQELKDSFGDPGNGVCIYFPPGSTGAKGDAVKVVVTGQTQFFAFLTGFVPGLDGAGKKTLRASATMRIEKAYDSAIPPATPNTYTPAPGGC
jgi:Flp pilus assembly pilin Flp